MDTSNRRTKNLIAGFILVALIFDVCIALFKGGEFILDNIARGAIATFLLAGIIYLTSRPK